MLERFGCEEQLRERICRSLYCTSLGHCLRVQESLDCAGWALRRSAVEKWGVPINLLHLCALPGLNRPESAVKQ